MNDSVSFKGLLCYFHAEINKYVYLELHRTHLKVVSNKSRSILLEKILINYFPCAEKYLFRP